MAPLHLMNLRVFFQRAGGDVAPLHSWICVYFQRAGGSMPPLHSWICVYFQRAGGSMPPLHSWICVYFQRAGGSMPPLHLMDLRVFWACGRQHAAPTLPCSDCRAQAVICRASIVTAMNQTNPRRFAQRCSSAGIHGMLHQRLGQ